MRFDCGGSFSDRAFVSSLKTIDITPNFTDDDCCILCIYTGAANNIKCLEMKYKKGSYSEDEVLIERNVEFFDIHPAGKYQKRQVYDCFIRTWHPPSQKEQNYMDKFRKETYARMIAEMDDLDTDSD